MDASVVILDNGAHTIKAGLSTSNTNLARHQPRIIQNAIIRSKGDRRMYIGPDIESCRDYFALHYRLPFEKGFLTDWDTEKAVWDRVFEDNVLAVDPTNHSLLVTEPYFDLPKIQDTYDQLVFEEYEFQSYCRTTSASLLPWGKLFHEEAQPQPECMIVVDAGFSFTHIVPILSGKVVWSAVKRIDAGGKLLTNQLKEVISYRHYNMMDQTYIINEMKEKCCFVSQSFSTDLEECRSHPRRNSIVQEYVLPDFSANRHGFVRTPTHLRTDPLSEEEAAMAVVHLGNERFSVPEILFNPSDIGLDQIGLPETIAHCISLLPEDLRGLFWGNIGLIGGSSLFPGFQQRLLNELRPLAPADCDVSIYMSDSPITEAYKAGYGFSRSDEYGQHAVSREEYLEGGSNACRRKFGGQARLADELGLRPEGTAPLISSTSRRGQAGRTRLSGRGGGNRQKG